MDFTYLKNFMDRTAGVHTPGSAIVIYQGGKEVFRHAAGYADMTAKTPLTFDCTYNIYSASKITTIVAALQLLEQGLFRLDDPIGNVIPEFAHMTVKKADGSVTEAKTPINVRHLMTMTAGFNYDLDAPFRQDAEKITNGKMDTLATIKCLADYPLDFEPGTHWQYSLCHDVLAAYVEAVSGMKFRDYVKKNIFDPLGMNNSVYHVTPEIAARMATQYSFAADGEDLSTVRCVDPAKNAKAIGGTFVCCGNDVQYIFGEEYDSGGAGITTTLDDYALLLAALANGGLGLNGARILADCTVELMRTDALSPELKKDFNWDSMLGYSYGLGVRTMVDRMTGGSLSGIGEFGWGGAAGAMAYIEPERKLAVFYVQHQLNPREEIFMPMLRNTIYAGLDR